MAISVVDLAAKVFPPDDWIIPNLLTRFNTGFMIGPAKKGKSWLLLDAAWSLSEGKEPWGIRELRPSRPMRTVYFTQEDADVNIQARILAHVNNGKREPNDRVWVVPKNLNMNLDTPMGQRVIQRELDSVAGAVGRIDLVMFDPFRRIMEGDENDSAVIAKIWGKIAVMQERYGCGTIISHHTVKPPRDKGGWDPTDPYAGRGSGDIYGGGDAFMMLVPGALAGDRMSRKVGLFFESKRAAEISPARLNIDFATGRATYLGELRRKDSESDDEDQLMDLA
jgi:RecA-family ATPase